MVFSISSLGSKTSIILMCTWFWHVKTASFYIYLRGIMMLLYMMDLPDILLGKVMHP